MLVGAPVEVVASTTNVEVKPKGVSKGVAVERIVSELEQRTGEKAQFVVCVGDDRSDEQMFAALDKLSAGRPSMQLYTCTVGQKPSQAMFYVNESTDVVALLEALGKSV